MIARIPIPDDGEAREPPPVVVTLDRALAAAIVATGDVRICPSGHGYAVYIDSESGTREWMAVGITFGRPLVSRAKLIGRLDLVDRDRTQACTRYYTIDQLTFRVQVIAWPAADGDRVRMRPYPGDVRPDPAAFVDGYDERLGFDVLCALDASGDGEPRDVNLEWRGRVIDHCLAHPDEVPSELWVDLCREESLAAAEFCAVRRSYRALVACCMERCDTTVAVGVLGIVGMASFDTYMTCRGLDLSPETTARLLVEARERLAAAEDQPASARWQGVVDLLDPPDAEPEPPVPRWTKLIIDTAKALGAIAVYLSPQKNGSFEIQFDDGESLHPCPDGCVPWHLRPGLVAKLKRLAMLDVAEKRAVQQGSFTTELDGTAIVWHLSIEPTSLGEKLTLRLQRDSES